MVVMVGWVRNEGEYGVVVSMHRVYEKRWPGAAPNRFSALSPTNAQRNDYQSFNASPHHAPLPTSQLLHPAEYLRPHRAGTMSSNELAPSFAPFFGMVSASPSPC